MTAILPDIVRQHGEEMALLHGIRAVVVTSSGANLSDLRRFDDRIAAHLDGLAVAGEAAWPICQALLDPPGPGALFAATAQALRQREINHVEQILSLAEAEPAARGGVVLAFVFLEPAQLQGLVAPLLRSSSPFRRALGLAVCAAHQVAPGNNWTHWLSDSAPEVLAQVHRAAGELGLNEVPVASLVAAPGMDGSGAFWATRSAVLLGDRRRALDLLNQIGFTRGHPLRSPAFHLSLQAMTLPAGHAALQRIGGDPAELRWLLEGSGINGDPMYVPWLIRQMADDKAARLAGEAMTLITGADLALLKLDRPRPETVEAGPNDDPNDDNVEMDPDEGLPWPDAARITSWWEKNGSRFQPGARYFMGAPVTREHCIQVLKDGFQRQRILAAHYLCLLQPGTPLFNTSAPAWRQQKLLAQM